MRHKLGERVEVAGELPWVPAAGEEAPGGGAGEDAAGDGAARVAHGMRQQGAAAALAALAAAARLRRARDSPLTAACAPLRGSAGPHHSDAGVGALQLGAAGASPAVQAGWEAAPYAVGQEELQGEEVQGLVAPAPPLVRLPRRKEVRWEPRQAPGAQRAVILPLAAVLGWELRRQRVWGRKKALPARPWLRQARRGPSRSAHCAARRGAFCPLLQPVPWPHPPAARPPAGCLTPLAESVLSDFQGLPSGGGSPAGRRGCRRTSFSPRHLLLRWPALPTLWRHLSAAK